MADREHIEILRSGVDAWNRWREDNSDIYPDLSHADLRGLPLSGANLSEARLVESDFAQEYLADTDFSGANLWGRDSSKNKSF